MAPGLDAIGVDAVEESVYLALLDRRSSTPVEIGSVVGVPGDRVRRALASLESKGLVSRTPGVRASYTAARPDLAIEALILRRQDELERAREEATELLGRFRQTRTEGPSRESIELVRGRDAVAQWWVQVQRSARKEVLIFDRPPYVMPFRGPNPVELELLDAGIDYRVLYDQTSFDHAEKLRWAKACVAAGEVARVRVGVPIKLLVADGSLALTYDGADVQENAVVIRPSAVLSGLVALFEALWRESSPLSDAESDHAAGLDELDRTILTMLGAGSKDERIARQLGLSVRTVRRRISGLVGTLGVETRFQAALVATRRGLL